MKDIGPIFRALTRNKLGALLIALQIALTMAIVTNAAFIIQERAANIARPDTPIMSVATELNLRLASSNTLCTRLTSRVRSWIKCVR